MCGLSDILAMKITSIFQYLRKLKDGAIILSKRKAQTIYYRLVSEYAQLEAVVNTTGYTVVSIIKSKDKNSITIH